MKTTLIALLLAVAMLVGCSDDDETTSRRGTSSSTEQSEKQETVPRASTGEQPGATAESSVGQAVVETPASEPGEQVATPQEADSSDTQASDQNASVSSEPLEPAGKEEQEVLVVEQETPQPQPESQNETAEVMVTAEPVPGAEETANAPEAATEPLAPAESLETATASGSPASSASLGDVSLPSYTAKETMKSRNYPFTPQVADDPGKDESVQASFGVEVGEGRPAVPEGVETQTQPTQAAPAVQPAAETAAAPATPEPAPAAAKETAEESKPQHDLSVGFGAPEMPKPAPEEPVAATTPEPAAKPVAVAPPPPPPPAPKPAVAKPKPALRKSGKEDRVLIADVPVQPLSPDKPLSPDAPRVTQEFKDFAVYWVNKISSNYLHGIDNKEVISEGGVFIARYTHLDKGSVSLVIKEKPYDHTPFVGLMKYTEFKYESRGNTPEEALAGKFEPVERLGITEIFRYGDGKWIE